MNRWDFHESIGMSKKDFFKILKTACKEILYVQPCFEMAPYHMFLLREHHVDIVTGSVADKKLLIQRLEQLHIRKGYEYNELFQVTPDQKNAKLNLGYDIYIDDNPKLAEAIDNKDGYTFCVLVTQPWNKTYQPKRNVMRAYNWEDVMEAIELFLVILRNRDEPVDSE